MRRVRLATLDKCVRCHVIVLAVAIHFLRRFMQSQILRKGSLYYMLLTRNKNGYLLLYAIGVGLRYLFRT